MPLPTHDPEFQPETLSPREREVVDLAIEGTTDEQISQTLGISVSTVNSYWVRIRGKVGQHSRTEIVARMLRDGFQEGQRELTEEIDRLVGLLAVSESALARSEADLLAGQDGSWHLLALHFTPESVLVARSPGDVVYANLEAERMFHAVPGSLVGVEVCELTVPEGREAKRHQIRAFMEAGVPGRLLMGVDEPCFTQNGDETTVRCTIAVEGFDAPEGFMAVFTVREFLGEIDAVLRSLRRPFATA